ncbi:hypothetical protein [Thioalkalivibrio denitrificans]|nr:hypothetical protein [Thioalkalivibrio denitrificans]
MVEEVIYISAEDAPDDSGAWDERNTISTLEQQHVQLPGVQCLSVVEGNLLRVERRHGKTHTRFYVRPGYLDPEPVRHTHLPRWQMAVAAVALGLSAGLLWLDGFGVVHGAMPLWGLVALLGLTGAGAAWWAYRDYGRSLSFVSRNGQVPLFRVMEGLPDGACCKQFLEVLRRAMDASHSGLPREPDRFLVEELKEHRRLVGAGGLDTETYNAAKACILRRHGRETTGAHQPN